MFSSLIGQEGVKSKLKFYAENHAKTGESPHLLFQGARGSGKGAFTREYAKQLCADRNKRYFEINSSSIKDNRAFFERVYPTITETPSVVFLDEAHKLPDSLQNDLLTILNTERGHVINYNFGGQNYEFDFTKLSVISATTDSQKLFAPLRDRLTVVDFEPYKVSEIAEIIEKYAPITFDVGLTESIAETCRGNPRSAVLMCKNNLIPYTEKFSATHLDFGSWEDIKAVLGIRPYGLTNDELAVLNVLKERGSSTLQAISGITSQSRSFVQNVIEPFLLKWNLIRIDGSPVKREITSKGLAVLK